MVSTEHKKRVKQELANAGVTGYGLLKSESRHLPNVIHNDEHIMAVVYGQFESSSAMLIATGARVIYLDVKPMAILMDEITYDVIQGVEFDVHTLFATLIMQTNIGNYTVRFANIKCASNFAEFLEQKKLSKVRRVTGPELEIADKAVSSAKKSAKKAKESLGKDKALSVKSLSKWDQEFLLHHSLGVLSTIDRTGNVYGAVVYYVYTNDAIYITTKASTKKAHNVFAHNQVSFTIYDEQGLQTMQINGMAQIEHNQKTKSQILKYMIQPKVYKGVEKLPPVAQNQFDSYLILKVLPVDVKLSDFN